jgi:hypothetical protein
MRLLRAAPARSKTGTSLPGDSLSDVVRLPAVITNCFLARCLHCLLQLGEFVRERWVPLTLVELGNEVKGGLSPTDLHDPIHPDREVSPMVTSDHDVVANFHRDPCVLAARQRPLHPHVGGLLGFAHLIRDYPSPPRVTMPPALLPEGWELTSGKIQLDGLHLNLPSGGSQFYRVRRLYPRPARGKYL